MKPLEWELALRLLVFVMFVIAGCSAPAATKCDPTLAGGTIKTIPFHAKSNIGSSTEEILRSYAEAWRGDDEFILKKSTVLGFWVAGEAYAIRLSAEGGELTAGEPEYFDWGFETDRETLTALSENRLNALTAMGQANANDTIPLQPRLPEGFDEGDTIRNYYIPMLQHFWNRSWPESVPFGHGVTRKVHGANTTVLVYDQGLRSAWYQLESSMHINSNPADQINDFDTAIIVTRGEFLGKLGGIERTFKEGETVLIPEGMAHEFYAMSNQYGEFIVLMWGDNA